MNNCNCKRCNFFNKECSGCSMCEAPLIFNGKCHNCIYTCRQRRGAAYYYTKIKQMGTVLMHNELYDMLIYIPTLPAPINIHYDTNDMPMAAVHGGKYMSASGSAVAKRYAQNGVRSVLNLNRETKIVLHFYAQDRTL